MEAVERILAYGANGNYLISEKDIKKVAGLSDADLNRICSYLKFQYIKKAKTTIKARTKRQIDRATTKALQEVYGIWICFGSAYILFALTVRRIFY